MSNKPPADVNSPAHLSYSFKEALAKVELVEHAFDERGRACLPSSSLGNLFSNLRELIARGDQMSEEEYEATFSLADQGQRIAHAVELALLDPGAEEAINRVADINSDMNLTSRLQSLGKDALFELELFRRLKLGNVEVRFGGPDLIVTLPGGLGEYGVACKNLYSSRTISKRLEKGCEQIERQRRPGVIALGLNPQLKRNEKWVSDTEDQMRVRIQEINTKFAKKHAEKLNEVIASGRCDGIVFITSVMSNVREAKLHRQTRRAIHTMHSPQLEAGRRIKEFVACLDEVIVNEKKDKADNDPAVASTKP